MFAPGGVFVTEIVDTKRSHGTHFAIVQHGVSGFSRPQVRWGEDHPLWILGDRLTYEGSPWTVVGPTCLPGDVLGVLVHDGPLQVGMRVAVLHAGAYGRSMSLGWWGSLDPVSEVYV